MIPSLMYFSLDGAIGTNAMEGAASDCTNVRRHPLGGLMPVRAGAELVSTSASPVIADRRGDTTYFFTLADGLLTMECSLQSGGTVDSSSPCPLGQLPAAIDSYAVCGEFVVLHLADGSLQYLLYDHSTLSYTLLGALPSLGGIELEKGNTSPFSAQVEPACFSAVQADPRNGDPETFAQSSARAVSRAFARASAAARDAGYWTQPVVVRIAWRLWDGSLLHVSDPVAVPGVGVQNGGSIRLPLAASDKGYTGTQGATLSLTGYKIRLMLPDCLPERWTDVIRSIELWVSQEPAPLTGDVSMGLHTAGNETALNVTLVRRTDADVAADAEDAPLELMESFSGAGGEEIIDVARFPHRDRRLLPAEIPEAMPPQADVVTAHGDFLHCSGSRHVYTSRRGNPFICACSSESPGGRVRAIAAQPAGGGAYTRQYVYLFTDRGIVALTHDSEGRHTNLRPIGPQIVRSPKLVAPVADGVCAVSEQGALLRLTDARVRQRLRGLTDYAAIAYCAEYNELWLISDSNPRWLALSLDGSLIGASYRTQSLPGLPFSCGQRLFCFDMRGIFMPEADDAPLMDMEWNGFPMPPGRPGIYRLTAEVYMDSGTTSVKMWHHDADQPFSMALAKKICGWVYGGHCNGAWTVPVVLPCTSGRYTLSVSGTPDRLASIDIAFDRNVTSL